MFTIIGNQRGSMSAVLIASVVMLVFVGNAMRIADERMANTRSHLTELKLQNIINNLQTNIKDEISWSKTVVANTNAVQCLGASPPESANCEATCYSNLSDDEDVDSLSNPCPTHQSSIIRDPSTGNPLSLALYKGTDGSIYYDAKNPTHGFSLDGSPCTTFSESQGADACPFRVEFQLVKRCHNVQSNPCGIRSLDIVGKFKFSSSSLVEPHGINNKSFVINRGGLMTLTQQTCLAFGGQYTGGSPGTCALQVQSPSCPQGSSVVISRQTNQFVCQTNQHTGIAPGRGASRGGVL